MATRATSSATRSSPPPTGRPVKPESWRLGTSEASSGRAWAFAPVAVLAGASELTRLRRVDLLAAADASSANAHALPGWVGFQAVAWSEKEAAEPVRHGIPPLCVEASGTSRRQASL